MNGQLSHAKAIGVIATICVTVALVLGMDLFFVLVIVYRAGWLNSLTSLIGMGVAATLLALVQFYMAGRIVRARYPELTSSVMQYSRTHLLKIVAALILALVALRFAVGAYIG